MKSVILIVGRLLDHSFRLAIGIFYSLWKAISRTLINPLRFETQFSYQLSSTAMVSLI